MKKQLLSLACIMAMVIMSVLLLVSCGHEHVYGEWNVERESTCSEKGQKTRVCECGEKESTDIPLLEHTKGSWKTEQNSTCVKDGVKTLSCKVCSAAIETQKIPATGKHNYSKKVTKAATCTETGTYTYTCKECGDSYTRDISKSSHKYVSEVVEEATCTKTGIKKFTCSGCDHSYTETIKTRAHKYSSKITKKASCTQSGEKTYTCGTCGDSYTATVEATGHTWQAATCEKPKQCKDCKTNQGEALGHSYDRSGECSRCGEIAEVKWTLPSIPKTITYDGYPDTICQLTKLTVDLDHCSSNGLWYEVTIEGKCTYNSEGNHYSTSMKIGYKVYDSEGFVVDSGTQYTEAVEVGEKFRETINIYYLEPGEKYTLVFLDVT